MFRDREEALQWILGLRSFGIRPGLERTHWMLKKLDHPHRRLRFIHVAGTNGKGSTCAFLYETLRRSGYGVGMFTSPYIDRYENRIQCDGEPISAESLVRLANRIKPLADELAQGELGPPTMFEVTVVLAILYFATEKYPDYVVWETGLGGRLDCTNVVYPAVSVITNVGLDHTDILGDTIERIAAEKAGIVKPGVPVVTTAEDPAAIEVIRQAASANKSAMYLMHRDFFIEPASAEEGDRKKGRKGRRSDDRTQAFDFVGPFRRIPDVRIELAGRHQQKNAAAALMTLEVLRQYYALILDDENLYPAFRKTKWPGRFEFLREKPPLIADGAHNPDGARALAEALQEVKRRRLNFLIGMVKSKNHRAYLEHILPIADHVIFTEPDDARKLPAGDLAQAAVPLLESLSRPVEWEVEPDWKKALERLLKLTGRQDAAVVTGTLYLVSDVRSRVLHQSESDKGW